jgi:hypothetical protein
MAETNASSNAITKQLICRASLRLVSLCSNTPARENRYAIVFNARHSNELADELIQTRCERGANIVLRLGFGQPVADGIYALDEHWNGKGRPSKLHGDEIPLSARIALLSQVVDVVHSVGGPCGTWAEVSRRRNMV